nr:hypothetical protein [Tanacetum cinerariifolium]
MGKESANESGAKFIPRFNSSFVEFVQRDSEELMNMFMRIGFSSAIKLISFDESQVVTFNSKFVYSFRNSDCSTGSRSDNTVGSPHRQFSGVEVNCFFDRMELLCFVDEVFDSECVHVQ